MSSFISYLISGISLGSVYAIIALGYTMVYGIAKMLNFAHGDVIMVGSYVVYVAVSGMGSPSFPSDISSSFHLEGDEPADTTAAPCQRTLPIFRQTAVCSQMRPSLSLRASQDTIQAIAS